MTMNVKVRSQSQSQSQSPARAAAAAAAVLVVAAAIAGCGGSSTPSSKSAATTGAGQSSSTASGASKSTPPSGLITVKIPGLLPERVIPKRYTCDGANTSLPVRWSEIPPHTAELVMFLASLKGTPTFFNWAVAGLSPASHGLSAGRLPPGAIVGRNSFGQDGYSICPPKGSGEEHYVLRLYAVPRRLSPKPGFDPEALYAEAEKITKVIGLSGGAYTR